MEKIVGLKELGENFGNYIERIKKGDSFIVVRRSKPLFRMSSFEDDASEWETVVDFTRIKKRGVPLKEVLSRL